MATQTSKLFLIKPNGDPFSGGWLITELEHSFDDRYGIYRGDLSPTNFGRDRTIHMLKHLYPNCKVRVER